MIDEANVVGYELVVVLLILYLSILVFIILFYRHQQKQIELAKNQAVIANQAKTNFLFSMSHDIRTPMNAILGYTDIALRYKDETDRVEDSLRKIKASGDHLLSLINDILEMSRIESGKLELTNAPMDIREGIFEIDHMGQALALSKDIEFSSIIGEIANPYVFADKLHMDEILINLISNGVKYTKNGGKVWFKCSQISDVVNGHATYRMEVSDTGIGMSEEYQKHLFEAFTREDNELVNKTEGAGLGLSIVKRIVDLANGRITVYSKECEGSTFVIELPLEVMDNDAIKKFTKEKNDTLQINKDISLEGKKVLLVEDNEMNREIAREILMDKGLDVDVAEDGMIALKTIIQNGVEYYDFVLMDIQMPIMNGYEATKEIRKLDGGSSVRIIALSANAFEEDKKKSMEAGMNDHVAKPIDVNKLFEAMKKLL